jgi:hypothetical protein
MPSLIYVHGTGVREPEYSNAYKLIEKKIRSSLPGWRPVGCFWGEEYGAKFHMDGGSIPNYATARAIGDALDERDESLILWQLLYSDPCYELFLIKTMSEEEDQEPNFDRSSSSSRTERERLVKEIVGFRPSKALESMIEQSDLAPFWSEAFLYITESEDFKVASSTNIQDNQLIGIVTRAITAQIIVMADKQGVPAPGGDIRDALVKKLLEELKSVALGIGAGYLLSRRMATYAAERRRGVLIDKAQPFAGDILLYQTRGEKIREFIRKQITEASDSVLLLAHSLGGVACVDLLIEKPPDNVIGIVTAGSQAPLLYELDCLKTLRHCEQLPDHFPRWLNIYDPHDFLSYQGRIVFPGRVEDVEIESNQPFPKSHSAYWSVQKTWESIAEFATKCLK